MGYRSEVVFAIEADAVPTMLAHCGKNASLKELLFAYADKKCLGDYDSEGSYLFVWDHIKWYESSPWAIAFQMMKEDIIEKLGDECYRFVRIGEEMDDAEVEGFGFEHIYVRQEIDY